MEKLKEKSKNTKNEFLDFLKNYNVIELATGVVIGNAVKDLVNSLVSDMIMPIIGIVSPNGSWREMVFSTAGAEFKVGNLLGAMVNFLIIAVVVFIVVKKLLRMEKIGK